MRIVDANDVEVPRGTVGEIVVRGGNVMLGYWNRPTRPLPPSADGWMHTGDGGYMDADGYVFVVDRIKDMIITGGENVYSVEVENVLLEARRRRHVRRHRACPTTSGANASTPSSCSNPAPAQPNPSCGISAASTSPTTNCQEASPWSTPCHCRALVRYSKANYDSTIRDVLAPLLDRDRGPRADVDAVPVHEWGLFVLR